jgi:glycosyltransferase involved in cell wall biosynthesis
MPAFYRTLDVIVQPTPLPGISRVALEAMSSGVAPIMLDVGRRGPVSDGATGVLVEPHDGAGRAIAAQVALFSADREACRRMGGRARQAIEESYSFEQVGPRVEAAYRWVVEHSAGARCTQALEGEVAPWVGAARSRSAEAAAR